MIYFRSLALLAICVAGISGCTHSSATDAAKAGSSPIADTKPKLTALKIIDVKKGDGGKFGNKRPLEAGDTAFVIYSGKLANGTEFDSNTAQGKDPLSFLVGAGRVIKGWDQGVVGMVIGGERQLEIPAELGYGDKAQGDKIPANSDLYFDVTLLDYVKKGDDNTIYKDDVKIGSGPEVAPTSNISLKYKVTDLRNTELDSNTTNGIHFQCGKGQVYPAIETGIQGMKQGGVRILRLPPNLAMPAKFGSSMGQSGIQFVKIELTKVS